MKDHKEVQEWGAEEALSYLKDAPVYESKNIVKARITLKPMTWTTSTGDLMEAEAGDWVLVGADATDESEAWTVKPEIFVDTYSSIGGGIFKKTATITGKRLESDTVIHTLEGDNHAHAGDWLVSGKAGDVWSMSDKKFQDRYRLVK